MFRNFSPATPDIAAIRGHCQLDPLRSLRLQASRHYVWEVDHSPVVSEFRSSRRQADHPQSPTPPGRCARQGIHLGPPHDVTDRLFVVQRAFRVNDSLPQESALLAALAMAARGMASHRPHHRAHLPHQPSRVRRRSIPTSVGIATTRLIVASPKMARRSIAVVAQISRRKPILNKVLSMARALLAPRRKTHQRIPPAPRRLGSALPPV